MYFDFNNLHSIVDLLRNINIQGNTSKKSEEESSAKDDTDRCQVYRDDINQGEGKKDANNNVSNDGLKCYEVSLPQGIQDTGDQTAKHEEDVEGEKEQS